MFVLTVLVKFLLLKHLSVIIYYSSVQFSLVWLSLAQFEETYCINQRKGP